MIFIISIMDPEILVAQNPWWKDRKLIEEDEDIIKWKAGRNWIPEALNRVALKPFALNFIFGPRQVGKTTLLKLLIRKLLGNGVDGEKIFYFRCDKLFDYRELDEVLKTYFEFRENLGIKSSFILLDEVTFPNEWYRTIKFYVDAGDLKNDVLVLTGSLSMFLKKEVEMFPGRRGLGKDLIMLPLSFREFIKVFSREIFQKLGRIESLEKDEIFTKAYKLLPYFEEMNKLFRKYLRLGGFPLCVKNERISQEVKDVYWSWIKTDLAKLNRNDETFKRVAKAILEKTPSALSLNSIAKEFDVGTHKTVYEYLDVMEKMFIAKTLYWVDPYKLIFSFKKNRKVVFTDPFFFHLFSDICLTKLPDEAVIVENIVASHLARKYEVFYWKDGREINIIARDKHEALGFEVKWRGKVKGNYSKVKVGKVKCTICLTEKEIDRRRNLLPIQLFLSLLDV